MLKICPSSWAAVLPVLLTVLPPSCVSPTEDLSEHMARVKAIPTVFPFRSIPLWGVHSHNKNDIIPKICHDVTCSMHVESLGRRLCTSCTSVYLMWATSLVLPWVENVCQGWIIFTSFISCFKWWKLEISGCVLSLNKFVHIIIITGVVKIFLVKYFYYNNYYISNYKAYTNSGNIACSQHHSLQFLLNWCNEIKHSLENCFTHQNLLHTNLKHKLFFMPPCEPWPLTSTSFFNY